MKNLESTWHCMTWTGMMPGCLKIFSRTEKICATCSVRLRYAIANRKVTSWRIGRCDVDYAAALRYLNKALEYLDEREKKEKEMLLKYMDKLPENWQVDLTMWRKEHGYHALTEARAKKWALERKW